MALRLTCQPFQEFRDLTTFWLPNHERLRSPSKADHSKEYRIIMPRAAKERDIYRQDAKLNHNLLTPAEREKLIQVHSSANSKPQLLILSTAIPSLPADKTNIKTKQNWKYPNHPNQTTQRFKARSPEVPSNATSCPSLRHCAHHLLCLHTNTTGISCCEG